MRSISQSDDKKIQQLKKELEQDSEVHLAILFGSYAKGIVRPESDIDIAIKLDTPLVENKKMQLVQLLAQIFGTAVDLVDLRNVGEPLLGQIIKYGKLIKGTKRDITEQALRNVYDNEDFLPYVKRALQLRRARWIK